MSSRKRRRSPSPEVSFGDDEPYNDADKVHNDVAAVTNTNTDDDSDDGFLSLASFAQNNSSRPQTVDRTALG